MLLDLDRVAHAPARDGGHAAHAVEHEEVGDRAVLARERAQDVLREQPAEDRQCRREEVRRVLGEVPVVSLFMDRAART